MLWLVIALSLCVLPHALRVPIWIPLFFFSLVLWRLFLSNKRNSALTKMLLLGPLIKMLVGVSIFVGIFLSYGTLIGRDAGVALLVLLAGMKLIEIRHERDYYITAFLGLLLILTNFFYNESILTAAYMVLCLVFIVSAFICFNDRNEWLNTNKRLHLATSLLVQAIPLMLVLFVLFPRVSGPLWGLPKDAHSGISGLDDEMSPGMISKLTLSDEVAFRVEFHGPIPDKSSLYWRGPVLWFTDGVKWVPSRPRSASVRPVLSGQAFRYTVTLEPTDKNWLYGLEHVETPPADSRLSHDLQMFTKSSVQSRKRYTLTSYTNYLLGSDSDDDLKHALQLPTRYHKKTLELANSWRDKGLNDTEIIDEALRMFNEEEFYYTLQPPTLLNDPVDQFLFDTRQGFCEHYSAAFVVLMRAAGIPARVVTGYQGGTVNPIDNYLIVRQRDAHAWAEVWLEDRGWVRIDPTSAVSPTRIREGIENALPQSIIDVPLGLQDNALVSRLWQRLRYTWDAMNNRWNQWILGYDNKRQSLFLRQLGLGALDWQGMLFYLIVTIALILAGVAVWLFKKPASADDEAKKYYDKFCAKLSGLGIVRLHYEGPRDFAKRASLKRKDLAMNINKITELYIQARYADQMAACSALKAHVSEFKPARHPARRQNL